MSALTSDLEKNIYTQHIVFLFGGLEISRSYFYKRQIKYALLYMQSYLCYLFDSPETKLAEA